jgi:hypothetical protein
MPRQIQGSQTDFSYGEVDTDLKRNDSHPARKGGLRQMSNARIHNSGTLQNRPGRRALYPITNSGKRTERFTISPGNIFDIQFAAGQLKIIDNTGTTVGNFTLQGGGAALPWASQADINSIVYAILNLSIYITFAGMRPQVVSWDGVSTWSIANYIEAVTAGGQKRTPFYRISPQNIAMLPSAATGVGISLTFSAGMNLVAGHVGTRMRFCGRQLLITAVGSPTTATATVEEGLPPGQSLKFGAALNGQYSVGDEVEGATSGAKGIVTNIAASDTIYVQLLQNATAGASNIVGTIGFVYGDIVIGPNGGSVWGLTVAATIVPQAVSVWDDEVMNDFRGYPASCFVDQSRLGFCNFPPVPGGIAWSAINTPTGLYVGANPTDAMFEIAPAKVQVYFVVGGPEGSEFVFTDRGVFYIPISETNPLRPGSVAFKRLSGDGAARVQPRLAQEAILYVNAGGSSMMAVIATGAYLRPYNTKSLTDYHSHLFNNIQCIAAPSADGTFNERYAYVLNGDGSIAVGKYKAESLPGNEPVIGWSPWSGGATVNWIAAHAADVICTSSYFGSGIVEILDNTVYLDASLFVNALPASFTPPGGKGPLWWMPSQTVFLMDQGTRPMGTYQIDANGFIVPQNNGGENLALASLVAGQIWTGAVEPFAPDAPSGADQRQRMNLRAFSYFAAYVLHSTGFKFQMLFSGKQTRTSAALGTPMNERRVPSYNMDDDTTLPPIQRETVEAYAPQGTTYDPRVAIVWDTPGPFQLLEIAMEITP